MPPVHRGGHSRAGHLVRTEPMPHAVAQGAERSSHIAASDPVCRSPARSPRHALVEPATNRHFRLISLAIPSESMRSARRRAVRMSRDLALGAAALALLPVAAGATPIRAGA